MSDQVSVILAAPVLDTILQKMYPVFNADQGRFRVASIAANWQDLERNVRNMKADVVLVEADVANSPQQLAQFLAAIPGVALVVLPPGWAQAEGTIRAFSWMRTKCTMNANYHTKLEKVGQAIQNAEAILIGGGAGLSASAGLVYSGERFTSHFADFIEQYGLTDMYSSGFYPFPTQEEKWAYWSRHIQVNRYDPGPGQVYCDLLRLVKEKVYFVITTNADAQFEKAGFVRECIFAVQGDYGKLQCAKACHDTLYDNEDLTRQMVVEQSDCRIPSHLVPRCPRCGEFMEPNLRKDQYFVEDDAWHQMSSRYSQFVAALGDKPIVLLELGVGYNTPSIIKFPFERITAQYPNATLVRINRDYPEVSHTNREKTIAFSQDIGEIIAAICER